MSTNLAWTRVLYVVAASKHIAIFLTLFLIIFTPTFSNYKDFHPKIPFLSEIFSMEHLNILNEARRLRKKSQHQDAFELLSANLDSVKNQNLLFENHPIWWSEIKAGICQLSRRSSKDIVFVRQIWGQQDFIYSFHRHANNLPDDDDKLKQLLDREYFAMVSESHALSWTGFLRQVGN